MIYRKNLNKKKRKENREKEIEKESEREKERGSLWCIEKRIPLKHKSIESYRKKKTERVGEREREAHHDALKRELRWTQVYWAWFTTRKKT